MARFACLLLTVMLLGTATARAQAPSPDDVPQALPSIETTGNPLLILLIGADTANQDNNGRTDVLLLAAIHPEAGTVSFLSIPRDLYVAVPDHGVTRINTAYAYGEMAEAGSGPETLIETIRYNLGIDVDYWARVDFSDFRRIIDDLGGIDIPVDCGIEDWRLREPQLDPTVEENWVQFTLPVGVHHMDGDLALWYARSRRTTSDFDRGRRHQALIQAIWRRIRELGIDTQITAVWPQMLDLVDTNLPLERAAELIPLGLNISPSQIAHFTLRSGLEVRAWISPEGSSVLAPNRDALRDTLEQFLTPPTANQLRAVPITVEVVNASGIRGLDQVAAWRLGWDGIAATVGLPARNAQPYSELTDLAGNSKGNTTEYLRQALNLGEGDVTVEPTADRTTDYRLTVGQNYYPCSTSIVPPGRNSD